MSNKRNVIFVTGNKNKLIEVQQIIGEAANVTSRSVELPELQGEPEEISYEKCKIAIEELQKDSSLKEIEDAIIVVEDTCLCFNSLKGLPGPYIKWFLEKLGHEGLNKLLYAYEDKSAYAQCTLAFVDPKNTKEPQVLEGRTPGKIVAAKGPNHFGWDPIFQPEMDKDIKNTISHRYRAFEKFKKYLTGNDTTK